ncbi:MAG: hypothetical protein JWL70_2628 [Acidimicrobiia bacterium]|nr:hypothetical protein [Acidimicrobiia bacterium]
MSSDELFVVEGFLNDRPAVARCTIDGVTMPSGLRRRCEIMVAMGDEFTSDNGGRVVQASLDDGPLPALLTVIRAFDKITAADVASTVIGGSSSFGVEYRCGSSPAAEARSS